MFESVYQVDRTTYCGRSCHDFRTSLSQLGVEFEREDEVVVLDDGTVLGIVAVDSVDLDMASDREWQVNRDTVADLYREIEHPVEIHSRKRRVDLSGYQCIRDHAVTTDHYVIIKEYPETGSLLPWEETESTSIEERIDTVVDRCRLTRNSLNAGDLSADHVIGAQLEELLQRMDIPEVSLQGRQYTVKEDSYRRVLAISKYPEERGPGLLSDVLNMDAPGFIDVIQTVEPVSDKQRKKLSRLIARMHAESLATSDPIRSSEIDRKLQDAQDLIDVEESGDERLVNATAYIVIRGDSWEQVQDTADEVTRLLRRFSVEYDEPWLETPQAVQTESPLHEDRLNRSLMMPSRSAASSFAFSTHDKIEEDGVSFGIDTRNGMPVVLDRYSWEAGHIARMGKIGSGKSYFAKLSLYRSWQAYDDLQIYIIDPKQEHGRIVNEMDGETVLLNQADLSQKETGSVTRYTVADRSQDNTDLLTQALRHVYREASEDTSKTIVLVDETHRLLSDTSGRVALGELVREGRDRNISVEMITQNASDFTRSQEGRDILKNVNCYIFMQHQDVDTGVTDFFNLSPTEAVALRRLRTGTDLPFSQAIIRGPVSTKLRIESTTDEHDLLTTEPDENLPPMTTHEETPDESDTERPNEESIQYNSQEQATDGGSTGATLVVDTDKSASAGDTGDSGSRSNGHRREQSRNEAFLELPDTCVTETENPDGDASAEAMLPDVLPGWERQTTTIDRWSVPVAEDWILATYTGPENDRYMIHVSRWQPDHVQYAIDDLFGIGQPTRFDVWTVRARFIFGVVTLDGSVDRARTLLTACPALSKQYIDPQE